MCTVDDARASEVAVDGAVDALRMAGAAMDYLNSGRVADVDGAARGGLLITLGELQSKLTAAHARLLRRVRRR
jgi:hypothetical protein